MVPRAYQKKNWLATRLITGNSDIDCIGRSNLCLHEPLRGIPSMQEGMAQVLPGSCSGLL